jgi:radical SAM superfamily enzyme YgiQ (UPF0313 family)
MVKVKIINGLPYNPFLKHPAPAYLQGALKQELAEGYDVSIADYTTSALKYLLTEDRIIKGLKSDGSPDGDIQKSMEWIDGLGNPGLLRDYGRFKSGKETTEKLVKAISDKAKDKIIFSGNTFRYLPDKFSYKKREDILEALKDENRKDNIFHGYLEELSESLAEEGNDIIGLSISDNYQLIPTLMLAGMVKEKKSDAKIVVGGDFVTRLRETYFKDDDLNRQLFDYIDVMVYGEGENVLPELIRRLGKGKGYEDLPKVIYRSDSRILHEEIGEPVECKGLVTPIFEGLYDDAITPTPVPAMQGSRGCGDQKKCAFCAIGSTMDDMVKKDGTRVFKRAPASKFVDDISKVSEELGTSTFSFTDLTLYPAMMKQIFSYMEEKYPDLKIQWDCYAQVDKAFTDPEFVKYIADKGCRFMQFGVESSSDETLDKMEKARSASPGDVLKTTSEAGIWNHVFYISGFPGSSLLDDLSMLPFLEENGKYALTVKPNRFKLSRGSKAAQSPEEYGLELKETGDLDSNVQFSYKSSEPYQSHHLSSAVMRMVERWVKQKHGVEIGPVLERAGKDKFTREEWKILKRFGKAKAPINDAVRTYVYHQRYFLEPDDPYIFALKDFAGEMKGLSEKYKGKIRKELVETYKGECLESHRKRLADECEACYSKSESLDKDLRKIWNGLVGKELSSAHRKMKSETTSSKFDEYYEQLKKENKAGAFLTEKYSDGFKDMDDLIDAARELKKMGGE